jgi:hypothetical protein
VGPELFGHGFALVPPGEGERIFEGGPFPLLLCTKGTRVNGFWQTFLTVTGFIFFGTCVVVLSLPQPRCVLCNRRIYKVRGRWYHSEEYDLDKYGLHTAKRGRSGEWLRLRARHFVRGAHRR